MRVVHMDSGLGNQMLDYAEYLAILENNADEPCYLENLIYELPHMPGMFSQWNGYELERIFGLHVPNIKELLSDTQWSRIKDYVIQSEFWKENWNFAPYITEALAHEGIILKNMTALRYSGSEPETGKIRLRRQITRFFRTRPGYHLKRYMRKRKEEDLVKQKNSEINLFCQYPSNVFIGHSLAFRYKGFGLERIEQKIRNAFQFPEIVDARNIELLKCVQNTNSVAIHARRSDLLFVNGDCYKYGYFKRCVKYIRKHIENPVFYFFCDQDSTGWCEENEKIFGLNSGVDKVLYVDWNKGTESYRDMQLMAQCKHNIFTQSSFGFWGAWLNENPNKITCAPDPLFLATNSF